MGEGAEDLRSGRQEVEEGAGGPKSREGEGGLGVPGRPAALWPSPFQALAVRSLAGTAVLGIPTPREEDRKSRHGLSRYRRGAQTSGPLGRLGEGARQPALPRLARDLPPRRGRGARPLADGLRAPRPLAGRREGARGHRGGRAVGGAADWPEGRGLRGRRAAGMAGAGLRAAARRWMPRRDHGGPRAASSSPSCPGCGPPGPGAHCPGAPRSAPAPAPAGGAAEPSAHLWARYQDMRRLVHGK